MSVIAIIPARGGSKGIPRKNLAMCAGKPLVDWVIQAANDSELIDIAILSSDDSEILERAWGKVLAQPRPPELAEDDTSTEAVMEYVLRNDDSDIIVLLQPTSPLMQGKDIDYVLRGMFESGRDSALTVNMSHELLWFEDDTCTFDLANRPRRQDIAMLAENGAMYVTTRQLWEETGVRVNDEAFMCLMSEEHRYQVDTPLDLEIVSMLLEKREAERALRV